MPAPTTATRREALALGMRAGLLVKHCKLLECSVAGYKEGADHGPVAEDLEILTCLVVVNDFEKKNLRYPITQRTERRGETRVRLCAAAPPARRTQAPVLPK